MSQHHRSYVPRSKFIEVSDNTDGRGALPPPPPAAAATYTPGQSTSISSQPPPPIPGIAMSHSWATVETTGTAGTAADNTNKAARRRQQQEAMAQQRHDVLRRLHETGEIDTIRTQLRAQLVECGWREEMRALAKQALLERGGVGRGAVSWEELVEELKPRSQSAVPENVKADLMHNVTSFMRKERGEAAPEEVEVVLRPGMSEV